MGGGGAVCFTVSWFFEYGQSLEPQLLCFVFAKRVDRAVVVDDGRVRAVAARVTRRGTKGGLRCVGAVFVSVAQNCRGEHKRGNLPEGCEL